MELQWPLILFTTLVAWSAGVFGTQAVLALRGEAPKAQLSCWITAAVLLAAGGIAVFFHLEHFERIFNGCGHLTSGITQELIAIVLLAVAMVLFFLMLRRSEDNTVPQWLAVVGIVLVLVLIRFFGTSLGLSIRATGDSLDMVSASSINPKATITIGLCLANALTALSGCLIGEYNKFCDINLGTGMVTIALASLIIGEVFAGRRGSVGKRVVCVVLGSIVYRFIIALALRLNISAEYFKLVSAVIVAVAIAAPNMKDYVHLAKIKSNARKLRALSGKGDETDA